MLCCVCGIPLKHGWCPQCWQHYGYIVETDLITGPEAEKMIEALEHPPTDPERIRLIKESLEEFPHLNIQKVVKLLVGAICTMYDEEYRPWLINRALEELVGTEEYKWLAEEHHHDWDYGEDIKERE